MKIIQCLAVAAMLIGVSAPLHAQGLHGAIAFSQRDDGGFAWGIAWRFGSSVSATAEAREQCRREGGTRCIEVGWFNNACGALAIGDKNGHGAGWGSTVAEAERDALRRCRADNANCRIEIARCSDSRQAAGGKGSRREQGTVARGEACRIFFSTWPVPQADWSGPCTDGLATGEGEASFEHTQPNHTMSAVYRGHARNGRFHGRGQLRVSLKGTDLAAEEGNEGEFRNGQLYDGIQTRENNIACVIITLRKGGLVRQSGC